MKTLTFRLPEELWHAFEQIAGREGKSAEAVALDWLARQAPKQPNLTLGEAEIARQRFRRHFGALNSGNPHSADNEQIDADLSREYRSTHEEQT